ncbi:hypothetical protein THRCLA_00263 [Thraustotheca clavata]|uniref:Jacalin-type lectin domain-containing protein n=1 Tax=Thraustotheca clavata TaxID=74557 RepID=A0A1W0ACJ7_9STRA|nr:hypothetical protein THRCLA_00263 [Thraustotheca clavata]
MKDAVVHVVSSVQDEHLDEELLHACTSIARVRPESIVIFFEDAAHLLDFALESSSSSSDSKSSSGSEAEMVAYHELESHLNEKQAFILLQYALPLLGMFREYCESRELTYSTVNLAPWGSLALFWCERSSNTMLRSIRITLDLLLEQLHDTISLDAPEQTLKDLVKDAPQAVFAALEPKLAHDEQFVAIILGQLVVQTTFPAATLTANSLWHNILDRMVQCDDVATLSTYLWFISMFISIAPMFISQDTEKLLRIVHRAVWLCTDSGKITQLTQSALLPPSKSSYPDNPFFKMFGKSQQRFEPSKFPPIATISQHEADEYYRIPESLSVLETFTETPSPGNRYRIRQIDIWFNQALDDSFPDGIRTLRLTVQDSDTGVLSVLNAHGSSPTEDSTFKKTITLEPGEYFTKFDVSFAEENGQHIKYVNALRFSTNERRYPWLGTPSHLPHLDAVITSPNDPPALTSSSSFEMSSGSDDSTILDGDEIIGLFGAFQDGILLEMGGVFATPIMPSPNIHVEHILLYTSYLFQSFHGFA